MLSGFDLEHAPGIKLPQDAHLIKSVHYRLMTYHRGRANAVLTPKIAKTLGITEQKVRAITNYLACNNVEVVALGNGYFFAETAEELDMVIKSLDSRASAIQRRSDGLKLAKKRMESRA